MHERLAGDGVSLEDALSGVHCSWELIHRGEAAKRSLPVDRHAATFGAERRHALGSTAGGIAQEFNVVLLERATPEAALRSSVENHLVCESVAVRIPATVSFRAGDGRDVTPGRIAAVACR